ncbi:hypothetical protein [Pseudomonas koreensis]
MSVHTMETLSLFNAEPYRRNFSARVIGVVYCEKIEKKSQHNRRVILRFA